MRPDHFRFRPPDRPSPPGADWVLRAAFGPIESLGRADSPSRALELARRLALSARIRHRIGEERLRRELGEESAAVFASDRHRAVASGLRVQELARLVGRLARERGATALPLKGAALLECGAVELGARFVADLDLLVAEDLAPRLAQALEEHGFARSTLGEAHHLPPLAHPGLGVVELHTYIPHLEDRDGGRLDAGRLLDGGLARAPAAPDGWQLPVVELLAAHAIAHGLDQHAFTPALGPVLRTLADLVDLAPSRRGIGPLVGRAAPFLAKSVSPREQQALVELATALVAGQTAPAGDAELLQRHALAAATDARYRRRLKRQALVTAIRRRDWKRFVRRVRQRWVRTGSRS